MKLIKKGKDPRDCEVTGNCRACGSEFEEYLRKLKVFTSPKDGARHATKPCTECNGEVIFYP